MTDDEIINFLGCSRTTVWRAFSDLQYKSQIAVTVRLLKKLAGKIDDWFKAPEFETICNEVIERSKIKELPVSGFVHRCLRQRNRLVGEGSKNDDMLNIIEARPFLSEVLFLEDEFLTFCDVAERYNKTAELRTFIDKMKALHEYLRKQGAGRHIAGAEKEGSNKDEAKSNTQKEAAASKREAI